MPNYLIRNPYVWRHWNFYNYYYYCLKYKHNRIIIEMEPIYISSQPMKLADTLSWLVIISRSMWSVSRNAVFCKCPNLILTPVFLALFWRFFFLFSQLFYWCSDIQYIWWCIPFIYRQDIWYSDPTKLCNVIFCLYHVSASIFSPSRIVQVNYYHYYY